MEIPQTESVTQALNPVVATVTPLLIWWAVVIGLLLMGIQICMIICVYHEGVEDYGFFINDVNPYTTIWSRAASPFTIWSDSILTDPGHDLVRLSDLISKFLMGHIRRIAGPVKTYMIWCVMGVALQWISLILLFWGSGITGKNGVIAAVVTFAFWRVFSQFPPLSRNQLTALIEALTLDLGMISQAGPLHAPKQIFYYPFLFSWMGILAWLVRIKRMGDNTPGLLAGTCFILSCLAPFMYFFHWFQIGLMSVVVYFWGCIKRWWAWHTIWTNKYLRRSVGIVAAIWIGYLVFQNYQSADAAGKYYLLMGGLQEARFWFWQWGYFVRAVMWAFVLLAFLGGRTITVILSTWFLGNLLLANMQMITGRNAHTGHWFFGQSHMIGCCWIMLGGLWLWPRLKKSWFRFLSSRVTGWISISCVITCLVYWGLASLLSWQAFAAKSRWPAERTELFHYLQTQPQGVILVPELWLENDVLVFTNHWSFLPRAFRSAVTHEEHLGRIVQAAFLLGYSREGFLRWITTKSVRFFGMLYGKNSHYSSSYWFDNSRKPEVEGFPRDLPSWDWQVIVAYQQTSRDCPWRLDWVVLHRDEYRKLALINGWQIVFQNEGYVVLRPPPREQWVKEWGQGVPIGNYPYPFQ